MPVALALAAMVKTADAAKMAAKRSFRILEITSFAAQPAPAQGQCLTNRAQSPAGFATRPGGLAIRRAVTPAAIANNVTPPRPQPSPRERKSARGAS
jgi:hypothetical protein